MKAKRVPFLRRAVRLGLLLALPALAAANTRFMKIAGLTGDVTLADPRLAAANQPGWIELTSTNDAFAVPVASGFIPGAPTANDVQLVRPAGPLSPELFDALCRGTHFATLEIREYLPGTPLTLDRSLLLEDVFLGSWRASATAAEVVREELAVRFRRFTTSDPRSAAAKYDFATAIATGPTFNNRAPTLATLGAQTTAEDTPLNVALTVGDPDAGAVLTVAASTDNPVLFPAGALSISGSGTARTLTLAPAPNQNGSATVSVIVSDGLLQTARSFAVTVTPVNDAPVVAAVATQTTPADTPLVVAFTVSDPDTELAGVTVTGSSSDPALLPDAGIVCSGAGASRTVTLTPAPGAYGTAAVTLLAHDGALPSSPVAFVLTVTPPPTAPTDILLSAHAVPENSAAGTVIGTLTATDLNGGPHTFELLSPAGGPFAVNGTQLVVAPGAALDYETTSTYVLSLRATDGTGLNFTGPLTVDVTPVNEAPELTGLAIAPQVILRGMSAPVPAFTVNDPDATSLTVTLSAPQGTLTLAGESPALTVGGNGTATLTLAGPISALNAALDGTHVTLAAPADFPAATPQTFLLAVSVSDGGQSGAGGTLTANGSVPFRAYRHRIEQWREEHFTAGELANASLEATLWGNTADPDGDGLNNVGEYSFHRDPRVADGELAPQPVLALAPDALSHLHLVLPVRDDDPELAVWFESGDSPASLSIATVESVSSQPYAAGYALRTLRDTVAVPSATRRFMRAVAELQYQP